jgi:cell filamentation protein
MHDPYLYDFAHLCEFHSYVFGSIYDWAGTLRIISMEKQEAVLGYMSIEYTHSKYIEQESSIILSRINGVKWDSLSLDEQAIELANNLAELWKVHPFREGNTRTTE